MLLQNNLHEIEHMAKYGEYVRIGHIWYGKDRQTTVPGIYYFAEKNVSVIQGIRAEAAMTFSNSRPSVDTVQIELVVNYSRFKTHVQALMALIQISPVIPILNPLVASLTIPMYHNKELYVTYGVPIDVIEGEFDSNQGRRMQVMKAYSQVPSMCNVDLLNLETISPREVQINLRLTRVLTANSYGDRTQYLRTHEDAREQELFVRNLMNYKKDDGQVTAMTSMLGIHSDKMLEMLSKMEAIRNASNPAPRTRARITKVLEGDMFRFVEIMTDGSESKTERLGFLYGVNAPIGNNHLREYASMVYSEPIKSQVVPQVPAATKSVQQLQAIIAKSMLPNHEVYLETCEFETFRTRITQGKSYIVKVPTTQDGKEGLLDAGDEMIKAGAVEHDASVVGSEHSMYRTYVDATAFAAKNSGYNPFRNLDVDTVVSAFLVYGNNAKNAIEQSDAANIVDYDMSKIMDAIMKGRTTLAALPAAIYRRILNTEGRTK